jgi:hypothetical protein
MDADLVDAIATCLKQDDIVGGYVAGHIGRLGAFENVPRYIEIGHTGEEPTGRHLVTIHLWSKSETAKEIQGILQAAERSIKALDDQLVLKREFTEVRYDDRSASFHGLLRMSLSRDEPAQP